MKFARIAALYVLVCAGLPVIHTKATAQSLSTASKGAEISVFGGYMPTQTDYGPYTLKGYGAGADLTIFPRFILAPSLEVRADIAQNQPVTEKTVLVGPRVQIDLRQRLHPYADFLIGGGTLQYHPAPAADYTGDRSRVFAFGGGINIDVTRNFGAKIDFQQRSWNLGQVSPQFVQGTYTLTPRTFLVGVVYTIPFRKLNRQADFR